MKIRRNIYHFNMYDLVDNNWDLRTNYRWTEELEH